MSPFTHAHRVNEPSYSFTAKWMIIQHLPDADRTLLRCAAGQWATARYVVLPHETHGYRAREAWGTLWEMHAWLERRDQRAAHDGRRAAKAMVPGAGIEPATRGFSIRCSTD